MGECNDSINAILFENIDKEITNEFQSSYHTYKRHCLD